MKRSTWKDKPRKYGITPFILVLWFILIPVSAQETSLHNASLFNIGADYFDTSDDFQYLEASISYRNHRRDMYWPYEEADSRSLDWGMDTVVRTGSLFDSADFNALAFDAFLGKRLNSGSYLEGGIGFHGIRGDDVIKDDTIPTYWAKGLFPITEAFDIGIETYYDYLYPEGFQSGSLTDALTAHNINGTLTWKPVSTLSIKSQSEVKLMSDSNTMFWTDFEMLYGISPEWPWIWAGAGVYFQKFEFESDDYWSPSQYLSYGPRLDSIFPISSRLTGWAEIHIDIVSENSVFEEIGDFISLGLDFAVTQKTHLLFGITRSDSIRDGDHYYENKAFLSLNWPLP